MTFGEGVTGMNRSCRDIFNIAQKSLSNDKKTFSNGLADLLGLEQLGL